MKSKLTAWIAGCFGFILAGSMLFSGCHGVPTTALVQSPAPTITDVRTDLTGDGTTLTGTTTAIQKDASAGKAATPVTAQPILDPYWTDILVQAGVQNTVIDGLKTTDTKLQTALTQTATLSTALTNETSEVNKLKGQLNSALTNKLYALIVVGILLFAGSVWLCFDGSPLGKGLGVASIAIVGGSVVVAKFYTMTIPPLAIYIGAGSIGLALAGVGIYSYIKYKKKVAAAVTQVKSLTTDKQGLIDTNQQLQAVNIDLSVKTDAISNERDLAVQKYGVVTQNYETVLKAKLEKEEELRSLSQEKAALLSSMTVVQGSTQVSEKVVALDSRLKLVEDRSDYLAKRMAVVETTNETHDKKLATVETELKAVEKSADQAKYFVEGMAAGMGNMRRVDPWVARVA